MKYKINFSEYFETKPSAHKKSEDNRLSVGKYLKGNNRLITYMRARLTPMLHSNKSWDYLFNS